MNIFYSRYKVIFFAPIFSTASLFIIALPATNQAHAEVLPPDAGTVVNELSSTQPDLTISQKASDFFQQSADQQNYSQDQTPIFIHLVTIEGSTMFTTQQLYPLIQHLENKNNTLAELQQATQKITYYYRQHGYLLARAYLPKQQLDQGVLKIQILEGRLAKVNIDNHSKVRSSVIQNYLDHIPLNQALKEDKANKALLLISDLPSVGAVQASLEAGQQTGQTNLNIGLQGDKIFGGRVGLDNAGSSYTGQYRLSTYLEANSVLGYGEKLSAQFLTSNKHLLSGGLSAQMPISAQGLILGANVSRTQYSLGEQFAVLDAKGTSDNYMLNLMYPIIRQQDLNLNIKTNFEYRKLWDEIAATDTETKKNAKVARLQFNLTQRDSLGFSQQKGGFNQFEFIVSMGDLTIKSPSALNIDQHSAKTNGSFQKYEMSLSRQQALTQRLSAQVRIYGQLASKNLDSSEKFNFNSMRAYPSSEGLGDEGWGTSLNLYYQILSNLSVSLFKDLGETKQNKNKYIAEKNSRYLASTGIGLFGGYKQFDCNATLAWRDTSVARSDKDKQPRLLVQAAWKF